VEARRRPLEPIFAALAALVIGLAFAACGGEDEKTEGVEGEYITAGDGLYQVQISRLMNPGVRPDDDLLRGQPTLPSSEQYMGVFLIVENEGDKPYTPPRDMKVVDTQGNEYLPIDVSANGFGLSLSQPIEAKQTAPAPDSPAFSGPQGGALLLFRIKGTSFTENLPLELKIPAGGQESVITLDL
jgi:hypothetical protein